VLLCFFLSALAACSDAVPCQQCPNVEGTYAMTWSDGGLSDRPCAAPGPRPATMAFMQSGSRVTTALGDVPLGGTLYDSYDLPLTGRDARESYAMRTLVIPTGTSQDGGIRLLGTLTTRRTDDAGDDCEHRDEFEGVKQR
jgi:hypothetical protein